MKVKIGCKITSSRDEPIMIILSERDKENIANMDPAAFKYCAYPDSLDPKDVVEWMDDISE